MDAALERADEVLISGRDRVRDLRTVSTAEDLNEALAGAAEVGPEPHAARFRLAVEGRPRALHPAVAEELAAIGREAILNARRHARCELIYASLLYDRRGLTLTIVDDGVGLDPEVLAAGSRAGHFGLQGMRERANKIEARLALLNRPGPGLKVEVFVPGRVAFATGQRGLISRLRKAIG
jgi:signal transduction histidine kinase